MSEAGTDEVEKMSAEEKAMMEQWESMASEDGAPADDKADTVPSAEVAEGEGGNTRILNQDEIDSLLGFDDDTGLGAETSGVMALINSAMVNYERLPMLDIVFDRLVRLMSTTLRNLTSDNVEVSLDQVSTVRFGDYMNSIPLPAMLSVFKAEEWDNQGLLVTDSALIYSIVDVLLGGRKGTPSIRVEGRPYTTIESKLVERMINVILGDLCSAFDPLSPVTFNLDRMETNPRFATISQGGNACVLARLRIDMGDRGGRAEILIPYATLEPIRELLLQMFMGEKFGRDSIWESHLTQELYKTDVQVQAILGEVTVPLGVMMNWKVGDQIFLNTRIDEELELRCGHFPMFRGPVGQRRGNIAVMIEKYMEPEKQGDS
ncbi:MAG: flagellar motor switch protein FliM [Alphaproteobacteria bacterium]|nr:flagellar motor switch protein FliM [Alphaproteobacteria bacterium]MBP7758412.1 flagellar motor switch protein FliM [Alphaproteobacteria bacterium]MBP7762407.1 flagellar motor switch protein FliM [Alphaproteobacteria bacterium]MBP7905439.1 flagellar motor switch protein FliM [Alphaproteobacteria bacterium]